MNATTCKTCGASIFFARTATGRLMPVDVEPVPDGNLALCGGVVMTMARPSGDAEPRYRSHYATCKQAALHRKKTTKQPQPK